MSQQNVLAARGLYDAFNRGDLTAFENGCARELVWNEAENSLNAAGNPYRSVAEVVQGVFQPTLRDFDGFRCDVEKLLDAGDSVVATGRYRGRHKATGKQLGAQFCHISHFDQQAKLDAIQEYTDTLLEAEVAGQVQRIAELRIPQPIM
jgi:ketosteroid isomerase-like protein